MTSIDEWDSDYESGNFEHWEFNYASPEIVALVAFRAFRKNATSLDAGCGGGMDAIFLAKCGFSVIGVDFSLVALQIANRRADEALVEVDWRHGDVCDLPVEDELVDIVTDRGLFHVLEDFNRPKYASEIFRVLKPHGQVIIRGASEESALDRFNPVTEEAVDKYFSPSQFKRGPILPIPLFSVVGVMDARIAILQKVAR
ncbi:MAG TPA: class I SAM-dependent methyltransferase [Candidatus Lokiarchaeia archaeon]|nr:class I SAM-dependent methyltransferase [Candidatus Lokiarchaeia archaeon]